MNNICIISYYGLRDALQCAASSLQDIGYVVSDFSLFKYMYDIHDKNINYQQMLIQHITENNINVVLWWFINIDTDEFINIKTVTGVKYVLFNWDEPFNWNHCDLVSKSKYFDAVYVTCQETLDNYVQNGAKNAYYLLPGFSPKIHNIMHTIDDDDRKKYACDISFCCTNLYQCDLNYPNQYINRKKLIDEIYQEACNNKFIFHIYGPDFLQELYPNSYRGYCSYDISKKVFNCSKINLCTHVLCDKTGYINERVILIGGCGGLLLMDNIKGIDKIFMINREVVILDKIDFISQIKLILDNYESYKQIKNNFYAKCINNYTYNDWAKIIHNGLMKIEK